MQTRTVILPSPPKRKRVPTNNFNDDSASSVASGQAPSVENYSPVSSPHRTLPPTPSKPKKTNAGEQVKLYLSTSVWYKGPSVFTSWSKGTEVFLAAAQKSTERAQHVSHKKGVAHFTRALHQRLILHPAGTGSGSATAAESKGADASRLHPFQAMRRFASLINNNNNVPFEKMFAFLYLHERSRDRQFEDVMSKCAVHAGDVEGRSFVVQAFSPNVSPLRDIAELCDDLLDWDGSQFVVVPLTDSVDAASYGGGERRANSSGTETPNTTVSPELHPKIVGKNATVHDRYSFTGGDDSGSSGVLDRPPFDVSTDTSRQSPPSGDEVSSGGMQRFPANTLNLEVNESNSLGTISLNNIHSRGNYSGVAKSPSLLSAPITVERWKRFCTVAALYSVAAETGLFDLYSFPFLSVRLMTYEPLISGKDVQNELLAADAPHMQRRLSHLLRHKKDVMPVALLQPVARKGCLRHSRARCDGVSGLFPSLRIPRVTTTPFSDAEVFQLFYLQLVFRAFFDIRFPAMSYPFPDDVRNPNGSPRHVLRSDWIGLKSSGGRRLAFQHPTKPDRWLLFPAESAVVVLLDIANAVVPLHASPMQVHETARLPLFGASPRDTPCVGSAGYEAVCWASMQAISSASSAAVALTGLFDTFASCYEVEYEAVRQLPVHARRFHCNAKHSYERMKQTMPEDLAHFLVPEPKLAATPAPAAKAGGESACPPAAADDAPVTTTPPRHEETNADEGEVVKIVQVPALAECVHVAADRVGGEEAEEEEVTALLEPSSVATISMRPSLLDRWRRYITCGDVSIFDGTTAQVELFSLLGRGGSGLVYRGRHNGRAVAVKVFVVLDGTTHEQYVRECLTDTAFYVLLNQLEEYGVCRVGKAHDFIVSNEVPAGMPEADVKAACKRGNPAETRLCYFITDVMDGTIGRFVAEDEDDYDPLYDVIVNQPLRDGELFQFLFLQLACKSLFDWKVLDIMLNGQLRGDNVGYVYLQPPAVARVAVDFAFPQEGHTYKGIVVCYRDAANADPKYLCFPVVDKEMDTSGPTAADPLKLICFIDVGQGIQPHIGELVKKQYIGETVIESCVQDDGFGRYWPLDEIYCKHVEVKGGVGQQAVEWGSALRIRTPDDAEAAMTHLFELYYTTYGMEASALDELENFIIITWSPSINEKIKANSIYSPLH